MLTEVGLPPLLLCIALAGLLVGITDMLLVDLPFVLPGGPADADVGERCTCMSIRGQQQFSVCVSDNLKMVRGPYAEWTIII